MMVRVLSAFQLNDPITAAHCTCTRVLALIDFLAVIGAHPRDSRSPFLPINNITVGRESYRHALLCLQHLTRRLIPAKASLWPPLWSEQLLRPDWPSGLLDCPIVAPLPWPALPGCNPIENGTTSHCILVLYHCLHED
jgi:hypothetical protein